VCRGRKRGYLLVAGLQKLDLVFCALDLFEGAQEPIDAVTGVGEDPPYTPPVQTLQHELRHILGHEQSSFSTRYSRTLSC
jgi:hypothetical protein